MNSAAGWRSMHWRLTVPAFTSRAANSVPAPSRLSLRVMVGPRPRVISSHSPGAVERRDMASLVHGQHQGVFGRINVGGDNALPFVRCLRPLGPS